MPSELLEILQAHVPDAGRCLDVGCGDGLTCGLWLERHSREYVGVDLSEVAVSRARAHGLDARVIEDAARLPFPPDRFDLAVCVEVLEHVFAPQLVAAEVRRVLRPGGRFLVTVPNVAYWRRRLELSLGRWNPFGDGHSKAQPWRDPHIRFFTRQSLETMLLASGFEVIAMGGHRGRATALQQLMPSLFGLHLHAVATKPDQRT
jgi:SAM-dependent methyltransferase